MPSLVAIINIIKKIIGFPFFFFIFLFTFDKKMIDDYKTLVNKVFTSFTEMNDFASQVVNDSKSNKVTGMINSVISIASIVLFLLCLFKSVWVGMLGAVLVFYISNAMRIINEVKYARKNNLV